MSYNTGFSPIARSDAKILILGSMPGEASLQKQEYYAHPRNAFWPIMCRLLDAPEDLSYIKRKQLLVDNNIALWDVLKRCYRKGSLDSKIKQETIEANDFATFFQQHVNISAVFFNGAKAEQLFKKYVLKGSQIPTLEYQRLPSTSPAHAALDLQQKSRLWVKISDKF